LFVYAGWQTFGGLGFEGRVFKGTLKKTTSIQAAEAKHLQTITANLASQNARRLEVMVYDEKPTHILMETQVSL
jgi:hypothetical protein